MEEKVKKTEEKEITKANGMPVLLGALAGLFACTAVFVISYIAVTGNKLAMEAGVCLCAASSILALILLTILGGLHIINPNEAIVMTLFGEYYGTIKKQGFYWTNPFVSLVAPGNKTKKKISLKTITLNNKQQKVNDALGNPVIIGAVAVWKVTNPTDAVFNVDDYNTFLSIQCDSVIRKIARLYPYDLLTDNDGDEEEHEKTLRGSSQEIAENMKEELQKKVKEAGILVEEVRITHLSYAEEIAAAMLQKQQATAIIAARKKIVEGAVSMVQMAINQLAEDGVVVLDEERKAAMTSNLLVVLCGNKEAQPVVNSSSIY
ncbi:MAG: SPFH domain-containing protein [Lachnospiraceae bacterium]|nr:SPFH domain-containing protein [Lachnospiraceae bacterium]